MELFYLEVYIYGKLKSSKWVLMFLKINLAL